MVSLVCLLHNKVHFGRSARAPEIENDNFTWWCSWCWGWGSSFRSSIPTPDLIWWRNNIFVFAKFCLKCRPCLKMCHWDGSEETGEKDEKGIFGMIDALAHISKSTLWTFIHSLRKLLLSRLFNQLCCFKIYRKFSVGWAILQWYKCVA